jgi:hypothetical protein
MAASVGGHAGKRTLTLSDVQGPAVVVLGSRPYQVSDHLVSKGASFDVVAELHRTEIFGLGVAAVRHIAVVGHGYILLRAGRHSSSTLLNQAFVVGRKCFGGFLNHFDP